jgi:ubiquinone/menaquinone biosynthesis C-methylase UbiE
MQAAAVPAGSRVLDVGAGKGRYRSLFAHCDYKTQDFGQEPGTIGRYTALDYESDITAIPVPDGSFDVVLCTEVLEHVPEPVQAVQEMARILKPGGRLLLTAPLGAFLHQEPYHFYGGYTPHWYRRFLPQTGFELVSLERNQGFFSWFGQESRRFHALLDPRRTRRTGWRWPWLTLLWVVTLPLCRWLLPLLGPGLDRLALETAATVGYHIAATKLPES